MLDDNEHESLLMLLEMTANLKIIKVNKPHIEEKGVQIT